MTRQWAATGERPRSTAAAAHRVPVIDSMMALLDHLERADTPLSMRDLVASSGLSRSTAYRILNTLEAHGVVSRAGSANGYRLGTRLVALAGRVPNGAEWQRLAETAQPLLNRLADETGETVKLSVLDRDEALCIAVAQGRGQYAVGARVGGRFPLHAGAASKILLAGLPQDALAAFLRRGLPAFTPATITDAGTLRRHLVQVRKAGLAEDCGEYDAAVHAIAIPVHEGKAALSIAYFSERSPTIQPALRHALRQTETMRSRGSAPGGVRGSAPHLFSRDERT